MIEWWYEWKTFGLKYPGSYGQQPAKYIDILKELNAESHTVKVKDGGT